MATTLSFHHGQGGGDRIEKAEYIDIDHLAVFGGRGVLEGSGDAYASNAKQHVEPAELPDSTLHHGGSLRLIGYVGLDRQGLATTMTDAVG
jgi:hypothetical protein